MTFALALLLAIADPKSDLPPPPPPPIYAWIYDPSDGGYFLTESGKRIGYVVPGPRWYDYRPDRCGWGELWQCPCIIPPMWPPPYLE